MHASCRKPEGSRTLKAVLGAFAIVAAGVSVIFFTGPVYLKHFDSVHIYDISGLYRALTCIRRPKPCWTAVEEAAGIDTAFDESLDASICSAVGQFGYPTIINTEADFKVTDPSSPHPQPIPTRARAHTQPLLAAFFARRWRLLGALARSHRCRTTQRRRYWGKQAYRRPKLRSPKLRFGT